MAELIKIVFGMWTQVVTRKHVLDGGSGPHVWRGKFWGQKGAGRGHAGRCPAVDVLKMTQQGTEPVRCRIGCSRWGAYWHNLANTIEPFVWVCGSDTASCQTTLTSCLNDTYYDFVLLTFCSWCMNFFCDFLSRRTSCLTQPRDTLIRLSYSRYLSASCLAWFCVNNVSWDFCQQ